MAIRAGIAVGILLSCCPFAFALNPSLDINQYAHAAWTIRDGFFKGDIVSMAQTLDGYLWLGTEFGLLRFDGVRSVQWQPPSGEHLPSNNIRRLLASRDGRLWIGTNQGLASWKDGKLTHYAELAGQDVLALLEDHEGTVWVGGAWAAPTGKLCEIRRGNVECFGDASLGRAVFALCEDSHGDLWAAAETGLWRWKPGPQKVYAKPDASSGIVAMIEGDNGALLIVMNGGLKQLVDGKIETYPLPGAALKFRPASLLKDRAGGLWIGTADRGLLHVHQGKTDLFSRPDGLSGDYATRMFEDREGNIWVATFNGGLDRFRDFAIPAISVKQGSSNTAVVSVLAARDGSIWLGTVDGLDRWSDGRVTAYRKRDSGLPDDSVNSLFEDDRARIWVTTVRGVAYFENGRFIPATAVPGGFVHSITADGEGNLWISHQDAGLLHLVQGRVAERIPWADLKHGGITSSSVPDSSPGGLWLGFFEGGIANIKAGKIRASYSGADGLGEGRVSGLRLDGDGTLWAATQGGLSRVKGGHVATLTGKNGLPCDTVHWSLEDDDRSVWLYTACGLVRIARADLDAWVANPNGTASRPAFSKVPTESVASAGPGSGFSPRVAKTKDGKLWFLGGGDVSVIDPRHLRFQQTPAAGAHRADHRGPQDLRDFFEPAPASAGSRSGDRLHRSQPGGAGEEPFSRQAGRPRSRLEGRGQSNGKTFYNDLPPRNYRFRVMASQQQRRVERSRRIVRFLHRPGLLSDRLVPSVVCGALILAMLWGLYRYRLHQIAREFNVRMEERVGERTRIARDLHDTLLQSFQGLMLHLQVVDDLLPQGKAKEELEKTLDRADQAIAEGRSAVYDLRSSATTTNDLAQRGERGGE